MYVDILKVLAQNGPLKSTHIMYKANVNFKILKEYLDYLIKHELIEERVIGKRSVVFANTARGILVLKYFREVNNAFLVIENRKTLPVSY
jgi:predicted transcriptional regulator